MTKNQQHEIHIGWKEMKKYFLSPLSTQKKQILMIFIALITLVISQTIFIVAMKPFMETLFSLGPEAESFDVLGLLPPQVYRSIFNGQTWIISKSSIALIIPATILSAGLLKNIATYVYQVNQQSITLTVSNAYRRRVFAAILNQNYITTSKHSSSKWMSIIMNDILYLQNKFSDMGNSFIKDGISVIAALILLIYIHWQTALTLFCLAPVIAFIMGRIGKKISFYADAFQKELANMANVILDLRKRFHFIRTQHGEKLENTSFAKHNDHYFNLMRKSIFIRSAFAPSLEFLGFSFLALVIAGINLNYFSQSLVGNNLWPFFIALGIILKPLKNIGEQTSGFQETKGVLKQSFGILFEAEKNITSKSEISSSSSITNQLIEIKHISCGYNDKIYFQGNNLILDKGKTIAIIGPSGAGKSTLAKTLCGLISPLQYEGQVSPNELALKVSMVSQNPYLFNDTIKSNLLYGNENSSEISDDLIMEILTLVHLKELIEDLPLKLDSQINSIDSNISGGQKQRIVVARALLRKFDIIVFDEATSAIDNQSEHAVIEAAINVARNYQKTFISITHRLQTLKLFDEVWYLENGKLLYQGHHDELLKYERYKKYCEGSI